jgi:hypothetical protein
MEYSSAFISLFVAWCQINLINIDILYKTRRRHAQVVLDCELLWDCCAKHEACLLCYQVAAYSLIACHDVVLQPALRIDY